MTKIHERMTPTEKRRYSVPTGQRIKGALACLSLGEKVMLWYMGTVTVVGMVALLFAPTIVVLSVGSIAGLYMFGEIMKKAHERRDHWEPED